MPNPNFQFYDWTNNRREGSHTEIYQDGELYGGLEWVRSSNLDALNKTTTGNCVQNYGDSQNQLLALQVRSQDSANNASMGARGRAPLPENYCIESCFNPQNFQTYYAYIQVIDWEYNGPWQNLAWSRLATTVPSPPWMVCGSRHYDGGTTPPTGNKIDQYVRNVTTGGLTYRMNYNSFGGTAKKRHMIFRRATGIGGAVFSVDPETGRGGFEYMSTFVHAADILNFTKPGRFCMGFGLGNMPMRINTLLISELPSTDWAKDAACTMAKSAGATIVGGIDVKTVMTDELENTYIVLHPNVGDYIEVDFTGTIADVPLFEVAVVANSTDVSPLSIKFATDEMGGSWSSAVLLGHTPTMRCASGGVGELGEKLAPGWTATKRHVFFRELQHLLFLPDFDVGCRRVRIENGGNGDITVYGIQGISGLGNVAGCTDGGAPMESYLVPKIECPLDETGEVQEINIVNTSSRDTASCKVLMTDDGGPDPAEAISEYTADWILTGDTIYTHLNDALWYAAICMVPGSELVGYRTSLSESGSKIWKTVTGGKSADAWTCLMTLPDVFLTGIAFPQREKVGWTWGWRTADNKVVMLKTSDGGANWAPTPQALTYLEGSNEFYLYKCAWLDENHMTWTSHWEVGGEFMVRYYKTTPVGVNPTEYWTKITSSAGLRYHDIAIAPGTNNINTDVKGYLVTTTGKLYKATTSGLFVTPTINTAFASCWTQVLPVFDHDFPSHSVVCCNLNHQEAWVALYDGIFIKIHHTTNAWASWTTASISDSFNPIKLIFTRHTNTDIGYLLAETGIYKTLDQGATWTLVGESTNGFADGDISSPTGGKRYWAISPRSAAVEGDMHIYGVTGALGEGGNWYDKITTPPDPDGITVGPATPEGKMPFYFRSKLPSDVDVFAMFRAKFQIKIVND